MKKETILRLFEKKKVKYHHYYKDNDIMISNSFNDTSISVEIESNDDYVDIMFKKDCNIFFDLVKDKKLKNLINVNNLKLIKENYLEKILKFIYETDNLYDFKDYMKIFLFNEDKEKIDLNKLSSIKKYLLLTYICANDSLLYVLKHKIKNKYFIDLLKKVDLSQIEDEEESSILKGNLNLAKRIIKENWTEENIIDYLEENNIEKLFDLIDNYSISSYKYVKEEKNRKIMFDKKIKYYIERTLKEPTMKKERLLDRELNVLKEIINTQIKDNRTDYIELLSIKTQSFIVNEIYKRIKDFNAEEYIVLLSEHINFEELENVELAKEYVILKKNVRDF